MPYPTHHDDASLSDMDTAWDDNEEVDELDTDSELAVGDIGGEEESVGVAHNPNPDAVISITLSNSRLEVRMGSAFATFHVVSNLAGMMLILAGIIGLALQGPGLLYVGLCIEAINHSG
ncbi:hypothetical protein AAF712_012408 [Marasmius tenuissimus]|uniref:Uncharacterized protein n=1 Tax=Marasmius tenuissimus TaxID=585030 RepID=A0ABR2ZHW0_9AGAR